MEKVSWWVENKKAVVVVAGLEWTSRKETQRGDKCENWKEAEKKQRWLTGSACKFMMLMEQ